MKQTSFIFSLIAVIMALAALVGYYTLKEELTSQKQNIELFEENDQVVSPMFFSVNDVLEYRSQFAKECEIDSIFLEMNEESLKNISTVVLGRQQSCEVKDIVHEYVMHNKDVYQYLKKEDPPREPSDTIKLKKQTPDTIINGQKFKLIVE